MVVVWWWGRKLIELSSIRKRIVHWGGMLRMRVRVEMVWCIFVCNEEGC